MSKTKKLITIIGLGCLLSHTLILYIIFLEAYFMNDFKAVLEINRFGEANIEFIIMPITVILGFYTVRQVMNAYRRDRKGKLKPIYNH